LTNKLESGAEQILAKIESMGDGSLLKGVLKGIETGYFLRETTRSSFKYQQEVDSGERVIVGVNKFQMEEEPDIQITRVDPIYEQRQIERLQEIKRNRDQKEIEQVLNLVRKAAEMKENLIPVLVDAVKKYVTLGEICAVFRDVFGVWEPPEI
jgi:methylmalonyl-CoA mutase N-terminal domain/subunit